MKVFRLFVFVVVAVVLAACSGPSKVINGGEPIPPISEPDPTPEPEPDPANIIVTDGSIVVGVGGATNERVTLTLENTGGPGTFYVEFWGKPINVPNPPDTLWGSTETYTVPASWSETAAWDVTTTSSSVANVRYALVFTRDEGSIQYRQTARYDF